MHKRNLGTSIDSPSLLKLGTISRGPAFPFELFFKLLRWYIYAYLLLWPMWFIPISPTVLQLHSASTQVLCGEVSRGGMLLRFVKSDVKEEKMWWSAFHCWQNLLCTDGYLHLISIFPLKEIRQNYQPLICFTSSEVRE